MAHPAALAGLLAPLCLAWAPLEQAGRVVAWPPEAWPRPLALGTRAWQEAATAWSAVGVAFAPLATAAPLAIDGQTTLAQPTPWAEVTGAPGAVALTITTTELDRIVDADVLVNTEEFRFDERDARAWHPATVLAHELGHVLGLGHACDPCDGLPPDDPRRTALMRARLTVGEALGPGPDDRAGAAAVVPTRGPDLPTPRVVTLANGWHIEVGPLALARTWQPEPAIAAPSPPLTLARSGPGPWHLELWGPSGHGVVVPLPEPPEGLGDAADAGSSHAGDAGLATPPGEDPAGCHQAPAALFLFSLPLARRKPRCASLS